MKKVGGTSFSRKCGTAGKDHELWYLESEQQLAVFDLLRKKSLSRKDRYAVKKAAVELLARLDERNLLMGHLRDMAAKQAQLRHEIENHL